MRTLALLFVLFGAAQQLSAQSLVSPSNAFSRLKVKKDAVVNQVYYVSGTNDVPTGLLYLRLEYYAILMNRLNDSSVTTQEALDKGALLLVEQYSKLPNTNIALTAGHVQTVVSETTTLLSN